MLCDVTKFILVHYFVFMAAGTKQFNNSRAGSSRNLDRQVVTSKSGDSKLSLLSIIGFTQLSVTSSDMT